MHTYIRSLFAGLLMSALFLGCQKENLVEQKEYPRLRETVVLSVDESGATCRALFLSSGISEIIDHGFVWSKGDKPVLNSSYDLKEDPKNVERLSLGKLATQSSFEAKLSYGLAKGNSYQVRSYLKTADGYTVYGHPVKFDSQGSLSPRITGFEPASAVWGDTITIIGENFSYLPGSIKVTFAGAGDSRVLTSTQTSIRCIVPAYIPGNEARVTVQTVAGSTTSSESFKVDTSQPVITGFTPSIGSEGDIITIQGKNFNGDRRYWEVIFGGVGVKVPVTRISPNEITAVIPLLTSPRSDVRVIRTNGTQQFISQPAPTQFVVPPPVLEGLDVITGSDFSRLRIRGSGFSNPFINISGSLNSFNTFISHTKNEIILDPIHVVFPKPTSTIIVEVNTATQQKDSRQFTVSYSAPWVKRAGPAGNYWKPLVAFTAGGNGYTISETGGINQPLQMHRFNHTTYSWDALSAPPFIGHSEDLFGSMEINGAIYIAQYSRYTSPGRTSLWKWEPLTNSWQNLRTLTLEMPPSNNSSNILMCGLGSKGYLLTQEKQGSVWEYNTDGNTWKQLRTGIFPGGSSSFRGTFAWMNKVYVLLTENNQISIYSYDPGTNDLKYQTNFKSESSSGHFYIASVQGNKVRLVNAKEYLEYDPNQNQVQLVSKNRSPYEGSMIRNGFMLQKSAFVVSQDWPNLWEVKLN